MPRIPRLSTTKRKLPNIPAKKADTSLRDAEGNVRPEQKEAMKQLLRLGGKAAKPYVDTLKRIFKKSFVPPKKKSSTIENIKSHKQRLQDAIDGKF